MTFQSNLNAAQASTQQDNIMNSFIKYYIDNELNTLKELILGDAPEALDTLKELADAISSDPNFFQSMADSNTALQTAIDAVQADVDQNESDSDAAIAAETSTRQASIDAVNALITTLQTEAAARLVRIEALEVDPTTATAVAAVQADVDQKAPLADPTFTGDVSFGSLGRVNPSGNELKFLNDTMSSGIVLGNKITLQSNSEVELFGDVVFESGLVDAADDTAAAAAGVDVNQLYRNGSVVMIRVS